MSRTELDAMSIVVASGVIAMEYTNDEDRDGKFTFEEFVEAMKNNETMNELILKVSELD